MNKFKILFFLIVSIPLFELKALHGEIVEEILFSVNGDIITKIDFEERSEILKQTYIVQSEKIPYDFENSIISNMIIDMLIKQESIREGINVVNSDVSNQINSLVKINNLGSIDNLKSYVTSQGMTWKYFFENQKANMYKENLLARIIIVKNPTLDELQSYYNEKKDEEFQISEKLPRLSVIYLRKEVSMGYSEILAVNALGKQIEQKIKNGDEFNKLAKEYSEDFKSKNLGGDSGWRTKEEFEETPELWDAIEKLKVGECTPLLSGKDGFYIFKLIDEKDNGYMPFERARKDIQLKMMRNKRQQAYSTKIKEIIQSALIKRKTDRFKDFRLISF